MGRYEIMKKYNFKKEISKQKRYVKLKKFWLQVYYDISDFNYFYSIILLLEFCVLILFGIISYNLYINL